MIVSRTDNSFRHNDLPAASAWSGLSARVSRADCRRHGVDACVRSTPIVVAVIAV